MPKAHPLFLEIASQFRILASDPQAEWSYSAHALEEMLQDNIDFGDTVSVLQNGKITQGQTLGDIWDREYRIEDISDGVHIGFIVCFSLEEKWIEIITAFRVRE